MGFQLILCSSFDEFSRKAALAMAVMDLLDELDAVFHEPVHLCDVKPEHFGISEQGRVKFLDLDTIFMKSIIGELMLLYLQFGMHLI